MGATKAILELRGKLVLEHVLDAAQGAPVRESLIVVGDNSSEIQNALRSRVLPRPVRWVHNAEPGSQQLRSLQLALEALGDPLPPAFFLHPVDTPLASREDYALLATALVEDRGEHDVFALSHGGRRGHPVLVRSRLVPALLALPGGVTARTVLSAARTRYVLTANRGVLRDMDTPADHARLERGETSAGDP